MARYCIKRILQMIPVLFLVSLISFALMYLAPSDPVSSLLEAGGGAADPKVAAEMRAELGLDQPVVVQYVQWLVGVCTGNLGESIVSGQPVIDEILTRLPATIFLAVVSLAITMAISIPLGFLIAVKHNTFTDHFVRVLTFAGTSVPGFLMALLLVYVFSIQLNWLPSLGRLSGVGWVLPVMTLVLCESAIFIRQVRTLVLQELEREYVLSLRFRGVSEKDILIKNVLKVIAPLLLIALGMSLGQLLGGTAIIETVFSWPGVGQYAVQEVFARDYPVIQGYVLFMALVFLVINLLVDIAQAYIDPRVRVQIKEGIDR